MREYPKVPQYYHSVAPDEIYTAEDLIILEKTDGQNFRVVLYTDSVAEKYSDELKSFDPCDGDVFVGTKGNIRGRLTDEPESFEFEFGRVLTYLQDNLNIPALRELHQQYTAPLVLFGEHMTPHSLDYNYTTSPPPAFLGFDIYVQQTADPDVPANPLEDSFDGFLPFEEMEQIFKTIGLDVINPIDLNPELPFDPKQYEIPKSNYADITAEGVVLRSDTLAERVKITTQEFEERNMYIWGLREDQADSGAELFVSKYVTNSRIHKQIYPHIHKSTKILPQQIAEDVLYDAFTEEWDDIGSVDREISITELWDVTITRCENVIEQMKTRSELHKEEITNLYEMQGISSTDTIQHSADSDASAGADSLSIEENGEETVEEQIIEQLFSTEDIQDCAKRIANEEEKSVGPWTIPHVRSQLRKQLWVQHKPQLLSTDVTVNPNTLENKLMEHIVGCLE